MDKRMIISDIILALVLVSIMYVACMMPGKDNISYVVYADETSEGEVTTEATEEVTTEATQEVTTESTEGTTETTTEQQTTESQSTPTVTPSGNSGGNSGNVVAPTFSPISSADLAALTTEYTDTIQEKNALQKDLNSILESQNDFITRLRELDDMIIEYQDKLDELEEKQAEANDMQIQLTSDIEAAEAAQDNQYQMLKMHIKEEYENGSYSYLDALFNAVDYMDIVNKSEYIQAVEEYDQTVLKDYTDAKQLLSDKQALLDVIVDDMSVLQEAYSAKQESLQTLAEVKQDQIDSYEADIAAKKAEIQSLEAIEQAQAAQIANIEASYRVSFTMNGGTGLVYSGEQFLWPCPSSSNISSYYGPRVAPTAGATSYHRGIDIPCSMGSPIVAVASGTVIYVGYLGSGGNAVIVDHGSGISSCYFHLSDFAVTEGMTVSPGQTICYSGNTGVSTGPHLHFAVRENGEYVNPLKYYSMISDQSTVSDTEGD